MELFFKNIAKHVNLNEEEKDKLLSFIEVKKFTAKSMLLKSGEICNDSYFILSGIVRSYTIDDHLVEHTLTFASDDWWISDMYSFLSGKRGDMFIEVLDDSEVVILSSQNRLDLFNEIPKMERYFRILVENSLVANQQRLMNNMTLTAEERYENFCSSFPNIKYKLPQKMIASYLGITPEFFSKMKSKLLKNK